MELRSASAAAAAFFDDRAPIFGKRFLLRTGIIAALSLWWVAALVTAARRRLAKASSVPPDRSEAPHAHRSGLRSQRFASLPVKVDRPEIGAVAVWLIAVTALAFLLLFLISPRIFGHPRLISEDGVFEILTAVFFLIASGLFIRSSIVIKATAEGRKLLRFGCAVFGFAFFIAGMEELSWFQHFLGFETPDVFEDNQQDETNLHNFAVNYVEGGAFFSAFLLLIVAPFLDRIFGLRDRLGAISCLIPGWFVLYASVPFAAYNYDVWNVSLVQFAFFITLFILASTTPPSVRYRPMVLRGLLLVLAVASQIAFLLLGHHMGHINRITEYKEFFLSVACIVYALDVLQRVK